MHVKPININNTNNINFKHKHRAGQENYIIADRTAPYNEFISGDIASINSDALVQICSDGLSINQKTYDSFTGLRDKNYLLAYLEKAMEISKNTGRNLSIAMFDMDNFKSVNELLGYAAGDIFIQNISQNIASISHKNMLPTYRFGGEEFVIVFDKQHSEKRKEIVNTILSQVNNNEYIQSKAKTYKENGEKRLQEYEESTDKINKILSLKTKKTILEDLQSNLKTEEAKNDPYFIQCLDSVNNDINSSYLDLVNECIETEEDQDTKFLLTDVQQKLIAGDNLSEQEDDKLNEYLRSVYDKTAELFQLKKWLNQFDKNGGFSLTGGIATYCPQSLENRTPMDLITGAGELLKAGKNIQKGKNYYKKIV